MRTKRTGIATVIFMLAILAVHAQAGEYVSAESVIQKRKDGRKIIIVDVRNGKRFDEFRIPGSINIPLHFIKAKNFLKGKQVVMVNEGFSRNRLENECRGLNEAGFNVSILAGGLCAWRIKGGKLEGDQFAARELDKVSPADFHLEKITRTIFDVSEKPAPDSNDLVPGAIRLTQFTEFTGGELPVLFNENGKNYEKIKRRIKNIGEPVFFLKGGLKAYRRFLNNMKLPGEPGSKKRETKAGCEPCNR